MRVTTLYYLLAAVLVAVPEASTSPVPDTSKPELPSLPGVTQRQIYQFAKGTYVENIAVRSNGNLVVTLLDRPEVYELNPFVLNSTPRLLWRFNPATRVAGIVEHSPEQFAVVVGNIFLNAIGGTFSLWNLDLRSGSATASPISLNIPGAQQMNGLALLPDAKAVLASDTFTGNIYRIDLVTGAANVAIGLEMGPNNFGLNGLRIRGGYAYYTNTATGVFSKIPIDGVTGRPRGPPIVLAVGLIGVDDFALGPEPDSAYISWLLQSVVVQVKGGVTAQVAGSFTSGAINGPTAGQFGRTDGDRNTLYVVTGGTSLLPVTDAGTGGGKVVAIAL